MHLGQLEEEDAVDGEDEGSLGPSDKNECHKEPPEGDSGGIKQPCRLPS